MFSNGADVNLNKVYRSASAASTDFKIGELYRQSGSNAVFKFVEIENADIAIVKGITLTTGQHAIAAGGNIANTFGGGARGWNSQATFQGIFQGIAQNDEAIIADDLSSDSVTCIWSQIAGNNVSDTCIASEGELGFVANPGSTAFVGNPVLAAGTQLGPTVASAGEIDRRKILYIFNGSTTLTTTETGLSVGDLVTPDGTAAGKESTVKKIYKSASGRVTGVLISSNEAAPFSGSGDYYYILANSNVLDDTTAAVADSVMRVASGGNVQLRGTY